MITLGLRFASLGVLNSGVFTEFLNAALSFLCTWQGYPDALILEPFITPIVLEMWRILQFRVVDVIFFPLK